MAKLSIKLNLCEKNEKELLAFMKSNNSEIENYISYLIEKDLNSTFKFEKNITFDINKNKLLKNDIEVPLTRIEKNLFSYLLKNKNTILSYADIHKNVWRGRNMSIYTLRNKINAIRNKTYYEIIKSYNSKGYELII